MSKQPPPITGPEIMTASLTRQETNGIPFYQFPLLNTVPGLLHGIFTRHGGVSLGPYQALNISYSVGDEGDRVQENRNRVREALGIPALFSVKQVHGSTAVEISSPGDIPPTGPETRSGDILLTRARGVGLMIKLADCQPVLLVDCEHQAIAIVHCGWRGNTANVLGTAILRMQDLYGTDPRKILAGIGPSLGPCCAQFLHYPKEFPKKYWGYQARPFYFDLWRLSRDQLLAAGLREDHIQIAGLCTSCRTDELYSYRKEKNTGRFAAVIAWSL